VINLGISKLPEIAKDNTDRNRTSPFAFTGNKFEFRAVGSSASTATPMATLNAAVGEALEEIANRLEARTKKLGDFDRAVIEVVREYVQETKAIRFEGNNYADEWVVEAEKRGLANLRKTPEALAQLATEEAKALFTKAGVYTAEELEARYHLELERYIKDLEIEVACLDEMVSTLVLPAAYKHQATLAAAVGSLKAVGLDGEQVAGQLADLQHLVGLIAGLKTAHSALREAAAKAESEDMLAKATALAYQVAPAMEAVRANCDAIELIVEDALWPLPKYREILFMS